MVELHINNVKTHIKYLTDISVIDAISRSLTYRLESAKFSWQYKTGRWDGSTKLLTKNLYFPTGCLSIVTSILEDKGIAYKLVDSRVFYTSDSKPSKWLGYDLYPYQEKIVDIALDKKCGMIKAATGCHAPGTKVIMYDGTLKKVEDVLVSDKLMGPDSSPREVLKLYEGIDDMYEIIPKRGGRPFIVNSKHILNLKATNMREAHLKRYKTINISVEDYLEKSKNYKNFWKLHSSTGVEWSKDNNLDIDPWFLGNSLDEGKIDEFIPDTYKISSKENRLQLLAGLMDSNGSLNKNCFDFCVKSKKLSEDTAFLARSLGFRVRESEKIVNRQTYYRLIISGNTYEIPTKIPRKRATKRKQIKSHNKTGFEIRYIGKGKYFGFQLDRDHLYMLDDFTITHNSGKSLMLSRIVYEYNLPTVIYVVSLDLLEQMRSTLEMCLGVPIGMVGAGICDIQKITVCSAWTAGRIYSKANKKDDIKEEDVSEDKWDPSFSQKSAIKEMIETAKLIMLDEAQFAAASSIRAILNNSKSASYRYGLSGTPWRSGGDDLLLEAAFGENICDLKATELIYKGYLVPPKIAFRDVMPPRKKIPRKWSDVKKNYIIENEERNEILIKNVVRLLEMGRKPLVMFREHKHGRLLESLLPSDINYRYVTGNSSKEERDIIRDDFKAGNVDLILASTVYDQGIDLPALDALVLAGGGKSTAKALQRIGRVIRGNPNGGKKDALVVETYDQSHYVKKHSIMRYQIYKTEPGFQIKTGIAMGNYINRYKP